MNKEKRFNRYKYLNLIGFSLLYNMMYIGRFNLNNLIAENEGVLGILPYQQQLLSSSVFFAYAIGSIINGMLADRYNPKFMVILGTSVSIIMNAMVPFTDNWRIVLVLWFMNGYFQSMVWVSGISLLAQWWKSGDRGFGCGLANFFSGLSHITAYVLPMLILMIFPEIGWREKFIYPMIFVVIFLIVFYILTKHKPENVGLMPYVENNLQVAQREADIETQEHMPEKWQFTRFLIGNGILFWCAIAFLSSICRYGLLKWIPIYFETKEAQVIINPVFSNLIFPFGMAIGTLLITWVAGKRFNENKGIMVIVGAALCGGLITIFPAVNDVEIIIIGIFSTGFFLYGINGILWIYAMDLGGRLKAGTIAGILNGFAYLGATLEAYIFPLIIKIAGNMISVFIIMEIFLIAIVACGIVVSNKNTVIESEVEE